MPSHTNHSALVKIYLALPGAPWEFSAWKEITGVYHGLFPSDDAKLPHGITRAMADDIKSYFSQYKNIRGEDEKMKFAAARKNAQNETVPGRAYWRTWITTRYPVWRIYLRITEILTARRMHPLQLMISNDDLNTWPASGLYLIEALDEVGSTLFGPEALDKNGRLCLALREGTLVLIQRTWENLKKQTSRNQKRLVKLEKSASQAFQNLDSDTVTQKEIRAVIRAVARWKDLAQVFDTTANLELIQQMEEELQRLMLGLGASVPQSAKSTKKKALSKVSENALSTLASQSEVDETISLYDTFFCQATDERPEVNESMDMSEISFGVPIEGADPGVEVEAGMTSEELARSLGFTNSLPFVFNKFRHTGGLTAWSPQHAGLFQKQKSASLGPDFERIRLHWHQLAGVHAIVRKIFVPAADSSHCLGMLNADEVGLGKTFQAATLIAFLGELAVRQKRSLTVPQIIKRNPYLADYNPIPDLPHLIIVPGTLVAQWVHELEVLFNPKSFDILQYGIGQAQHEDFFSPTGPYNKANHSPCNRIIVASHSALFQDYNLLFSSERGRELLPWDNPEPHKTSARDVSKTLFGYTYVSTVIDEAQVVRNNGARHCASLTILNQSLVRLILTATPLQTSTRDVAAMGRLTGIPHFSSREAFDEEREDTKELRRARQEKLEDPTISEDNCPVKLMQIVISNRMNTQFGDRILRRTIASKDNFGKPLIDLPPLSVVEAVVNLTPREMAIIDAVTEVGLDSASSANAKNASSSTFYIEHRMGVTFARENPDDPIPVFKTLEEWEPVKSTKIDTCARICRHLLTRDDAPPITFSDGEVHFPHIPAPGPGEKVKRDAKILIYQEFPSFGGLVRNILRLYGVESVSIDGRTSYERRAAIVRKFTTDPKCRVLVFSKVGSVGLNLSRAKDIIYLDQPWSAQDERQTNGRAHRQPQKENVVCYHLLAADTADITLAAMARGKRDMLEAFLSTETAKGLMKVLSGDLLEHPDEEGPDIKDCEDEEVAPKPKKAKGKAKSRRTRSKAVVSPSEDLSENEANPKVAKEDTAKKDVANKEIGEGNVDKKDVNQGSVEKDSEKGSHLKEVPKDEVEKHSGKKNDGAKLSGTKGDGEKDSATKDDGGKNLATKDDGEKDKVTKDDDEKDKATKDDDKKDKATKDDDEKDSGTKDDGTELDGNTTDGLATDGDISMGMDSDFLTTDEDFLPGALTAGHLSTDSLPNLDDDLPDVDNPQPDDRKRNRSTSPSQKDIASPESGQLTNAAEQLASNLTKEGPTPAKKPKMVETLAGSDDATNPPAPASANPTQTPVAKPNPSKGKGKKRASTNPAADAPVPQGNLLAPSAPKRTNPFARPMQAPTVSIPVAGPSTNRLFISRAPTFLPSRPAAVLPPVNIGSIPNPGAPKKRGAPRK